MLKDQRFSHFTSKEILLYALLLNRAKISAKNKRNFCDEKGVFVYYSNNNIMRDIRCGNHTASRLLQTLEQAGLIKKEYQKTGLPLKIYVKDFEYSNPKPHSPAPQKDVSFDIERAEEIARQNRTDFGSKKNKRRIR